MPNNKRWNKKSYLVFFKSYVSGRPMKRSIDIDSGSETSNESSTFSNGTTRLKLHCGICKQRDVAPIQQFRQ